MSTSRIMQAPVTSLAKPLASNLVAQLTVGCVMAFPGAAMDVLLARFHWTIGDFASAALLQGTFGFLGNLYANWRIPTRHNLTNDLRFAQFLVLAGALFLYGFEFFANSVPWNLPPFTRALGFAFIGFGVGIQAIINNTQALRTHLPSSALMLVAFTFTFGALLFPLVTGLFLASISTFTVHNWKATLLPVLFFTLINIFWPWKKHTLAGLGASQKNGAHPHQRLQRPKSTPQSTESEPQLPPPSALLPYSLGALLFLYLGIEICLTTGISLQGIQVNSIPAHMARFGPSALWLGVLVSRLATSILPLRASHFQRWTWQAAIPLAVALAIIWRFPMPILPWLVLIFLAGAIMGPFYGLIVGQASYFYSGKNVASKAALVATLGGIGAIVMPFVFGKIANAYGISSGFLFLAAAACALFAGSFSLAHSRQS